MAASSSLLDTNVPPEQRLYGYHRLDDPMVMTVEDGNLLVTLQSELSPPEPEDILKGVYDINDNIVPLQETA